MSYSAAAVRACIREVCEGAIGATRTVAPAMFRSGVFTGQDEATQRARALVGGDRLGAGHRFDVRVTGARSHGSSPVSALTSLKILELDIEIAITTHTKSEVQDAKRAERLAEIMSDGETAVQALCYPANLVSTVAGTTTNIIAGLLQGPGSHGAPTWELVEEAWSQNIVRSKISASCLVRVSQNVFDPGFMTNLHGTALTSWYRAGNEIALTAGVVHQWGDLSTNSYDLTQAVAASRPALVLGGQGGREFVRTDATTYTAIGGVFPYVAANLPPQIYVIGKFISTLPGSYIGMSYVARLERPEGRFLALAQSSLGLLRVTGVGDATVLDGPQIDTNVHLYALLNDGTNVRLRVDNGTEYTAVYAPSSTGLNRFALASDNAAFACSFDFYEALTLNAYPSAANQQAMRDYANNQYGLSI